MDQSTLAEDHFAYCYDKPRKTDVAKDPDLERDLTILEWESLNN